jgi:pyruvate/2-oxoglutarate dehydrogenase complex dihydrolipoamide dehydrogenase (E3) component
VFNQQNYYIISTPSTEAMLDQENTKPLSVAIIGAGIGGLVCAIACRRQGLQVTVLERAHEIKAVRSLIISIRKHALYL